MLEEEQISFRSASPMFDGVEDYSHQIAEMIGLRNESNFREVGVCMSAFLRSLHQFVVLYGSLLRLNRACRVGLPVRTCFLFALVLFHFSQNAYALVLFQFSQNAHALTTLS